MKQIAMLRLLQVLREETDADHRLSQQQLRDRLQKRFGIELNRRTLKAYLDDLQAAGYPLNATEISRPSIEGTSSAMQTGWYIEPELESSELRLLSDLLASAPALPEVQRQTLLEKLLRQAPPTARAWEAHIAPVSVQRTPNPQLLYTVEQLCDAMERSRMVQFSYCSYTWQDGTLALTPRKDAEGAPRRYTVSPYQIAVSHGQYYLLCCTEPYSNLSSYRLDRIAECQILSDRPRTDVRRIEGGIRIPETLAEHLYMYAGAPVICKFLIQADRIGDAVDWFGREIAVEETEDPAQLLVTVSVHPTAMRHWAMQYGHYVTVTEPAFLRADIAAEVRSLSARYE